MICVCRQSPRCWLLLAFAAVFLVAHIAVPALAQSPADLDTLLAWITGSFSSAVQAAADTSYSDIRLHMVPLWADRTDGRWLYVEQAAAQRLDRPYRQRIYRVRSLADGRFESAVYTLPNPLRLAGAWYAPQKLSALTPDSLQAREGCAVYLRRSADGSFQGSTEGHGCPSDLRGAKYATSEVTIRRDELLSWDRGFDEADRQVWGATKGGYVFLKDTYLPRTSPENVLRNIALAYERRDLAAYLDQLAGDFTFIFGGDTAKPVGWRRDQDSTETAALFSRPNVLSLNMQCRLDSTRPSCSQAPGPGLVCLPVEGRLRVITTPDSHDARFDTLWVLGDYEMTFGLGRAESDVRHAAAVIEPRYLLLRWVDMGRPGSPKPRIIR